jgi:hypothetical protein
VDHFPGNASTTKIKDWSKLCNVYLVETLLFFEKRMEILNCFLVEELLVADTVGLTECVDFLDNGIVSVLLFFGLWSFIR